MQLDLMPRTRQRFGLDSWLIPNWLDLQQQNDLLTCLRGWCKGGWYTPQLPNNGPKLKHPLACLGYQWRPYEYFAARVAFPHELQLLCKAAIAEAGLKDYLQGRSNFVGDTAIVNYFPDHEASPALGMHQDRSELDELINAGSPIITVSLGDRCIFRFGNPYGPERPYEDVELYSGDLLIMAGRERSAFHGVMKILPDTTPAGLIMDAPGRISVTMRQAQTV